MTTDTLATYPHHVSPAMRATNHQNFQITTVDIREMKECTFEELPNLELKFQYPDGSEAAIWFRVDVRHRYTAVGVKVWPFTFETDVFEFAVKVAKEQGLKIALTQTNVGKSNRTAIKNLMHLLYNPWTSAHNALDPEPANRILRTTIDTTKLYAWAHKDNPAQFLKQKQASGLCGFFAVAGCVGFFTIESLVGSIGPDQFNVTNKDALLEAHRAHLYECWPFMKGLGLTMEYYDQPFDNLHDLNCYTGIRLQSQLSMISTQTFKLTSMPDQHDVIGRPKADHRYTNITMPQLIDDLGLSRADGEWLTYNLTSKGVFPHDVLDADVVGRIAKVYRPSSTTPLASVGVPEARFGDIA